MEKEMETSKIGRPCRVLGVRLKLRSQGVTGRPFPRRSPLGPLQRDEGIVVMKAEQRQAYVGFSKVQGGSWGRVVVSTEMVVVYSASTSGMEMPM